MSYADEAREKMRSVLRSTFAPVYTAGATYAKAQQAAVAATDLVEAMQATVGVVLAVEHLREMAEEAEKSVRAVLAEQMMETGATTIQTDHQTAYLSRKAAWVSADQEDLLPPEYMRQPPPAPDKKAIKAAIEAGSEVPGCTLVRPNDFSLVLRSKGK